MRYLELESEFQHKTSVVGEQTYVRLFSFPYAGANASTFRGWRDRLPVGVTLHPVVLPGRQARFRQPLISNFPQIVTRLVDELEAQLEPPVAFFGYSLGGLIAFEVAREMRRRGKKQPALLVVASCAAPQLLPNSGSLHKLPDRVFQKRLAGIIPSEVRTNAELMSLVLPMLRADITLFETYSYRDEEPLDCRICAFGGRVDPGLNQSHLRGWKRQTRVSFSLKTFEGGHFFVKTSEEDVLRALHRELSTILKDQS